MPTATDFQKDGADPAKVIDGEVSTIWHSELEHHDW